MAHPQCDRRQSYGGKIVLGEFVESLAGRQHETNQQAMSVDDDWMLGQAWHPVYRERRRTRSTITLERDRG